MSLFVPEQAAGGRTTRKRDHDPVWSQPLHPISAFHQWVVRQLARVLLRFIDDRGAGVTLWAPIALRLPGCDPVQPDLLVLPHAGRELFQDGQIVGTPALLIEVLGSNIAREATVKRRAYANAAVPEYWIVRLAQRDVLRCTTPDAALGDFAQCDHVGPDGQLTSPLFPPPLPIASLFAGAPDTTR